MLSSLLALVLLAPSLVPAQDALAEARALLDAGRAVEAEELLQGALEQGAEPRAARLLLAEAALLDARPEQALEALEPLDAQNDHEVALLQGRAMLAWAKAAQAQGAPDEDVQMIYQDARRALERAVGASPPTDTRALYQLGVFELYDVGDPVRAREIAESGLSAAPGDPEMLLLRGCAGVYDYWNLAQAGEDAAANEAWNASVDDLIAAEKGLPQRAEPSGQLTWLYEQKGIATKAVEAAIKNFDRQDPPSFDLLYRLAKRYASEGRYDAAGAALEKVVTVSAREVTTRLQQEGEQFEAVAVALAQAVDPFARRNDNATARNILAPIVAAGPKHPWIWENYAFFCGETRRFDDAVAAYEKRIELAPGDPRPYNDLASLMHHQMNRDLDRCAELYRTCISLADEELKRQDLPDARRAEVAEARTIAQGNLDELQPSRGLLDSVLEGLGNIELPEVPESAGGEEGGEAPPTGAEGAPGSGGAAAAGASGG